MEKKKDKEERGTPSLSKRKTPPTNIGIPDKLARIKIEEDCSTTANRGQTSVPSRDDGKKKKESFQIKKWEPQLQAVEYAGKGKEISKLPIRKKKWEFQLIKKEDPEMDNAGKGKVVFKLPIPKNKRIEKRLDEGECSARIQPELPAMDIGGKGKGVLKLPKFPKKRKESFEMKKRLEEDPVNNGGKGKEKWPIGKKRKEVFEMKNSGKGKEKMAIEKQEGESSSGIQHECMKCGQSFGTSQALEGHYCSGHNKTRLTIINTNALFRPRSYNNTNTKMSNIDLNRAPLQEEEDEDDEQTSTVTYNIDLNKIPPNMDRDDDDAASAPAV